MIRLLMSAALLAACGTADEVPAPPAPESKPAPPPPPPRTAPKVDAGTDDGAGEVAKLVVHDVGTPALGAQLIEASCVSVTVGPAGDWTIATAHLVGCGDKTARSIVWLYKRQGAGKWSEDYAGQPPKCWKGLPADIRGAVVAATKIPAC